MESSNRLNNRSQLEKCFIDLAKRAEELEEHSVAVVCYCLAGSILDRSDDQFADWCSIFAENRLEQMKQEDGEGEDFSEDKP